MFPDGRLGLIDFGAVGRLDPIQQAAVVDILAALMRRDVSLLRDGIERVAEVHNADSPEQLERALARLMADHVRATGAVEPSVLQDLVATLARFGIRLPGRSRRAVARARHRRRHPAGPRAGPVPRGRGHRVDDVGDDAGASTATR